jgi:hypothetical protein
LGGKVESFSIAPNTLSLSVFRNLDGAFQRRSNIRNLPKLEFSRGDLAAHDEGLGYAAPSGAFAGEPDEGVFAESLPITHRTPGPPSCQKRNDSRSSWLHPKSQVLDDAPTMLRPFLPPDKMKVSCSPRYLAPHDKIEKP